MLPITDFLVYKRSEPSFEWSSQLVSMVSKESVNEGFLPDKEDCRYFTNNVISGIESPN